MKAIERRKPEALRSLIDMNLPEEFAELLEECSELIDRSELAESQEWLPVAEPLPSLLERCAELVEHPSAVEPIRTIHHFACTGGTLIAKCIASMPNTGVLSEVEPHSRQTISGGGLFHPTDLLALLRVGTYQSTSQLESAVFLNGLETIYKDSQAKGLRLVLRDHAHGKFCFGELVSDHPSLLELLRSRFEVRSVVTVRHPLDSYLSLLSNQWLHFQPSTLEEYSKRYLQFLQLHEGLPVCRYEELVRAPHETMMIVCDSLDLPFSETFEHTFNVHRLSGDSGRSSGTITMRPRRETPEDLADEKSESASYRSLCGKLGYEL
ncbi:MAG: sulfotransferase family protein [Pseudomonadota bacterium]